MKKFVRSLVICSLLFSIGQLHSEDKTHAVFVIGTPHYNPGATMPPIARQLEEKFGFKCSVISTRYNPEKNEAGIPGLEKLSEADVAIFYLRFLTLKEDQLSHIIKYVESGKPVVGLRTSSHAFSYPNTHKLHNWNDDFGLRVIGSKYFIHGKGPTTVSQSSEKPHPILYGLDLPKLAAGTLYLSDIPSEAQSILKGTGQFKKTGVVTNAFGTHHISKTMTDDVAWVWKNEWGGKVFSTSLGHPHTFADKQWVRFIINAIHWASDKPIPKKDFIVTALPEGIPVNQKY